MKYFAKQRRDHGSILYDNGNCITSDPLQDKLDTIKRMKASVGVSRIFAPKITASDIEQDKPVENDGC